MNFSNLKYVVLADAKLGGADLEKVDLTGAILDRADLTKTRMAEVITSGANMTDSKGLSAKTLAIFLRNGAIVGHANPATTMRNPLKSNPVVLG
ncbi:pentapeptide repeat-containing protein [Acerihabitans sp. KWT182]|uniref:Pentapeptide repeat-containing protein n=1 Tax=Acerihabitans sp. KWT182 TaxID=3157919 RepID=A0AAU7QA85_9GAMM